MPNIFNADNGAISGSAGIKLSSDTSGVLNIQTNGTTAISISSSQVVSFPATSGFSFAGQVTFAAGTAAAPSISVTGDTNTGIYFPAADTIAFAEGGTEVMRLDSSGNLGLGVTPSVWNSAYKSFDIATGGGGSLFAGAGFAGLYTNAFVNTSGQEIYKANGFANQYVQVSGSHRWYNAPSGTAGNTISFTQAMTLSAAGELLVGATSLATGFSTFAQIEASGTTGGVLINSSTNQIGRLMFTNNNAAGNEGLIRYDGSNSSMQFWTAATERARITSGGEFYLGTTNGNSSSNYRIFEIRGKAGLFGGMIQFTSADGTHAALNFLDVNGLALGTSQSYPVRLFTNDTERVRITSTGNFGVATSSPSYLVDIASNTGTAAHLRATGSFITRKYTFEPNLSGPRTLRVTLTVSGLQFVNFFLDMMGHFYINGGAWEARRYAFQFMCEGSILRMNQRMPNYEYGGSTAAVFTVGNPPSWTYVGGNTFSFDFTVATGYVSYVSVLVEGPGIENITITQIS